MVRLASLLEIKLLLTIGDKIATISIDSNILLKEDYEELRNLIINKINEFNSNYSDDDMYNESVKLNCLNISSVYQSRKGGCNLSTRDFEHYHEFTTLHKLMGMENYSKCTFNYKIHNFKSKNNNCGLVCLIKGSGSFGNKIKADSLRKKCDIPLNSFISCNQLCDIANIEFHSNLIVINLAGFILFNSNTEYDNTIILLLENEHYQYISLENMKIRTKCEHCGK